LGGSEGIFYVVNNRGNVWGGGTPTTLSDWDSIVSRLDKQGAIEENVVFVNRGLSFDIDNMLATLNGYTSGGVAQSASFGLFDNDVDMALNLGFTGFRRGYDFYKSDWKYLNDPTMRGGLNTTAATATGTITGLMVPAGSTSVYDQIMGKNAKRPFLHVRYRASEAEDLLQATWMQWRLTSFLSVAYVPLVQTTSYCSVTDNKGRKLQGGCLQRHSPFFKIKLNQIQNGKRYNSCR